MGWILKTEVSQNKFYFILLTIISITLGGSINLALQAEKKISEMILGDAWNADLVVLPKGTSLIEFRNDLLAGRSTALLPEALFDTTMAMAKGQFQATAVLGVSDGKGKRVLMKSEGAPIGVAWLQSKQVVAPWEEQQIYKTNEWGYKVISGFFASGSPSQMESLKNLVDRRTVAQAFLVRQQFSEQEKNHAQFEKALILYTAILVGLGILAIMLLFFGLRFRIAKSLSVFDELGFSRRSTATLIGSMMVVFCLLPGLIGYAIATSFLL